MMRSKKQAENHFNSLTQTMLKKLLIGIVAVAALPVLLIALSSGAQPHPVQPSTQRAADVETATTSNDIAADRPAGKASVASATPDADQHPAPSITLSPPSTDYAVTAVVDGDTIKISMGAHEETLRLIGIDTPETLDPRKPVECFGREASNKAKELLAGKRVRIESDPTQGRRDKYGRLLVYVHREDGLFINRYMIEQGYAHEYTYAVPYQYQSAFKAAQQAARDSQRGLWSPSTCNGIATSSAGVSSQAHAPAAPPQPSGTFYTSSYHTARYYYPASCDGWHSLSPCYLKSFPSLDALLAAYPSRIESSECQ